MPNHKDETPPVTRLLKRAAWKTTSLLPVLILAVIAAGCGGRTDRPPAPSRTAEAAPSAATPETAFLDTLEERTFDFFWERSNPVTGLTPDRWPTQSFISVSAVGFALTAYPIGVERGYVTRAEAARRVLNTLSYFWTSPQDSSLSASIGYRGFFYHFLVPETGLRFKDVELSTVDTALFLAGALFCQSYFDGTAAVEDSIRVLADSLYARTDWRWFQVRPPTIALGWSPEEGFQPYDWRGFNEAMLLHILALGSPTHPAQGDVWSAWLSEYHWGEFYAQEHVGFPPLFGHQYTHVWVDFRGIRDSYMHEKGIDYFENSRRATYAQQAYAIANPDGWSGYGTDIWGLTACDGPVEGKLTIDGRERQFHTYWGRGASFTEIRDDGTISPAAAGGSVAFVPEIAIPALIAMRRMYGDFLFSQYGFLDAFNPTLRTPIPVQHGRVVPDVGWFDTDYLGIDEGPILAMIENHRSELIWKTMKRNPHLIRGLKAAGFTGGWLDGTSE